MNIIINGQLIEFSLENEKTVGDILQAIEKDCSQNNATIISISINDTLLSEQDFDTIFEKAVDEVEKIELSTISENDVLAIIKETASTLSTTIEKLQTIPVLLQSSKDNEVSNIVVTFIDQFHSIQNIAKLTAIFPQKFASFNVDGMPFADFLNEFTPILQEFESSLLSHDTVLTGDLAEYEIAPKLQAFVDSASLLNEAI